MRSQASDIRQRKDRSAAVVTRRGRQGFTVVEVMVAAAIVVILAAVAVPVVATLRHQGNQTRCLGNLRAIGVALEVYLGDNNDRYPDLEMARTSKDDGVPVLETVLAEYIGDPETFHCPADREQFAQTGSSYLWNSTQSDRHRLQTSFLGMDNRPERVPLVLDKEAFHSGANGVNMLYADYHLSNEVEFHVGPQ